MKINLPEEWPKSRKNVFIRMPKDTESIKMFINACKEQGLAVYDRLQTWIEEETFGENANKVAYCYMSFAGVVHARAGTPETAIFPWGSAIYDFDELTTDNNNFLDLLGES